jgi:hypothetical protein
LHFGRTVPDDQKDISAFVREICSLSPNMMFCCVHSLPADLKPLICTDFRLSESVSVSVHQWFRLSGFFAPLRAFLRLTGLGDSVAAVPRQEIRG